MYYSNSRKIHPEISIKEINLLWSDIAHTCGRRGGNWNFNCCCCCCLIVVPPLLLQEGYIMWTLLSDRKMQDTIVSAIRTTLNSTFQHGLFFVIAFLFVSSFHWLTLEVFSDFLCHSLLVGLVRSPRTTDQMYQRSLRFFKIALSLSLSLSWGS